MSNHYRVTVVNIQIAIACVKSATFMKYKSAVPYSKHTSRSLG